MKTQRHVPTVRQRRQAAFTLIELLVVASIIVILLTIMLPTLNRVRLTAMRQKCMDNVRSLGQSCVTYATTGMMHRGSIKSGLPNAFPPTVTGATTWHQIVTGNPACLWLLITQSYSDRERFFCPEAGQRVGYKKPGTSDTSFTYDTSTKISSLSYSYLSMVDPYDDQTFMGNKELDSRVVIIADKNPHYGFNSSSRDPGTLGPYRDNSRNHDSEGQMIAHLDGAAEWLEYMSTPPAGFSGALSNRRYDKNGNVHLPGTPPAGQTWTAEQIATDLKLSIWDDIYSSTDLSVQSQGKRGKLNDSFLVP